MGARLSGDLHHHHRHQAQQMQQIQLVKDCIPRRSTLKKPQKVVKTPQVEATMEYARALASQAPMQDNNLDS